MPAIPNGVQRSDLPEYPELFPIMAGDPFFSVLGPANFLGVGLGNLRVGLNSGTDYVTAFVFTSQHTGIPTSIRVYTPNDGGGYAGGTGGTMRVRLYGVGADDLPNTSDLIASGSYVPGLTAGAGGDSFPVVTLSGATRALRRGALYAFVFDNTDTTNNNFVSLNCVITNPLSGPPNARQGLWASRSLIGQRTGGPGNFPPSWTDRTTEPVGGYYYAIISSLVFSTGIQGFIAFEGTAGNDARTYVASNANPVRERVVLNKTRMVRSVLLACAAVVGGTATVDIVAADGTTVIATGTVTQTAADDALDGSVRYLPSREIVLDKEVRFAAGAVYFVRFTPAGSATFRFATSSNGSRAPYGSWTGAASWTQSKTQNFNAGTWRDIYVYDFTSTGYGDTYLHGFGLKS